MRDLGAVVGRTRVYVWLSLVSVAEASLIVFESRWQIEHHCIICSRLPSLSLPPSFSIHHSPFSDRKGASRGGSPSAPSVARSVVGSAAAVRSARLGKLEFAALFCRN